MKSAATLLVFCVSGLLALGLVMLYSASDVQRAGGTDNFVTQLIAAGIGLSACVVMAIIDYRFLQKFGWFLYLLAIGTLIAVLFQEKVNGSHRWFRFPFGFSFQASELAKIALLITIAWYGARFRRHMQTFRFGLVVPGLLIALVVGLVVIEPDVGTALLIAVLGGILLFLGGVRLWYCALPAIAGAVALGYVLTHDTVRSGRVHAWLHPKETKMGIGNQAWGARVAFGAGGWTGRGLGSSRQKYGYVPFHHTDFIFPIIGEELGLPATLGIISGFVLFLGAGFYISSRAPDRFGELLGAGITLMIGLQGFINIAVVTGVFPNKGLPLPFISYGGSNLILLLGCVGILLSIARQAREDSPVHKDPFHAESALTSRMP